MRIRSSGEEGMAMVIALLVSMVLLILSTVIVAQSIHDAQSTGYDRQRLTSVDAAESGGELLLRAPAVHPGYVAQLQPRDPDDRERAGDRELHCDADLSTMRVVCLPLLHVMTCPFTGAVYPSSVLITTTGTVGGQNPEDDADLHPPYARLRRVRSRRPYQQRTRTSRQLRHLRQ